MPRSVPRVTDRVPLAHLPTPVEPMDRLGAALGFEPGALWVKRDDCTGLAGGGNKARKLEYLCADALAQGCDTLVTGGGRQSNHVRMTAAAANKLGLGCTIVLAGTEPSHPTGNVVLDFALRPDIVWAGKLDYYETEAAIETELAVDAELRQWLKGR
jgi:D-cysteine desulfhydrase